MAIHSGILAWKIPWTQEPTGLQSMGSQRVSRICLKTLREIFKFFSINVIHQLCKYLLRWPLLLKGTKSSESKIGQRVGAPSSSKGEERGLTVYNTYSNLHTSDIPSHIIPSVIR